MGQNSAAPFTLKMHRGDGMTLLAMNWKDGIPPKDFVGFGIESKEPGAGKKFFAVNNRLSFSGPASTTTKDRTSSLLAPIQLFRWVHFPRNAELSGAFTYRVTPVFMDVNGGKLTYGEAQQADIELARVTYPRKLNIAFTRGFIASQAFVDFYCKNASRPQEIVAVDRGTRTRLHAHAPESRRSTRVDGLRGAQRGPGGVGRSDR